MHSALSYIYDLHCTKAVQCMTIVSNTIKHSINMKTTYHTYTYILNTSVRKNVNTLNLKVRYAKELIKY